MSRYYEENKKKKKKESQPTAGSPYDRAINSSYKSSYKEDNESPYQRAMAKMNGSYRPQGNITTTPPSNPTTTGESAYQRAMARLKGTTETQPIGNSKAIELNRKHYEDKRKENQPSVKPMASGNLVNTQAAKLNRMALTDEEIAQKKAETGIFNKGYKKYGTDKLKDDIDKFTMSEEDSIKARDITSSKRYEEALENAIKDKGLTKEEADRVMANNGSVPYAAYKEYYKEELANSPMEKQLLKFGNDKNVGSKYANAMVNYDLNSAEDRADRATTREYEQSRIRNQEDFLERNQYEEDKSYIGNEDYDAVNNNLNAGTISDQLYEGSHLTMEQRQNYNYVYNTAFDEALAKAREWTSDEEEAQRRAAESAREEGQKYLDMVHADEARTDYFNEFAREYGEEHPTMAAATSVALTPIKSVSAAGNLFNLITGHPTDENSLINLPGNMSNTMRNSAQENLDKTWYGKLGYKTIGEGNTKKVFSAVTSVADNLLNSQLSLGNKGALNWLFTTQAGNDGYVKYLEMGYSPEDAAVMGITSGAIEYLTEKYSIEQMFNMDSKGLMQVIKSTVAESSEEGASDILNEIADRVYFKLRDEESTYDKTISELMARGMSEEQAKAAYTKQFVNDLITDMEVGGLSGAGTNVAHQAINKAQIEYNQSQAEYNAVKNLDEGARNVLLNLAETSSDEKTQKMAAKVKETEGKKRNVYDTAQVIKRVIEENNIDNKIENDLKAEGVKKKDIATAKAAIEKSIAEVNLTDEEYNLIQTEPVKKVLTGIAEGNLDATYERQLAVNDAIELARNGGKTVQTNVTPSTETAENGAENNVESADESKKVVALSNYARNAQQRLGTMPIESLNDIQDVVNDEEGNIQIVTNDGNKVNNPYVKNRALGVVINNATTLFNDGASAKSYIQNFDPAMNLKAYNTITTEMIKAGKADAGTDKSTLISTVKSLQNMGGDVGYYAKKLPASFFNDMYAYGVKEENQRSEVVASDPQRNVINAIASQFSNSGLNITIEDNNTEYNGKLVGTNNLVLSSHADKALMSVLSHELTHYFKKKTNLYNDYEKAVIDFLKESGQYEELVKAKKKQGYADNEIDEEIVADAAENFLSDKKVIDRVCKNDKNLANKIISWLNQTIKDLKKLFGSADPRTAEGRIMKNLEKQNLAKYEEIRDLWVNAYEAATKADSSIDFTKEANVIKYSFASYMAQDYNKEELIKGEKLLDEGKSYQYIFKNTGWFRGADGKWRFEISDDDMKVYPRGDAKYLNDKDYQRYKELENKLLYGNVSQEEYDGFRDEFDTLFNKYLTKKDLRLDDVITHDKLFKSYPTLRLVRVSFERLNGAKKGTYKPVENKIVVDEKYKLDIKGLKKVLLHEMQHAIQRMESMSPGASVDFYENPLVQVKDTAEYDKYKYLQKEMKGILDRSEDFKNQYEVYDNLLKEFSKTQNESYLDKANKIEEKLYDKYPKLMDRYQDLEFEYMLAKDNLVRKDLASELYYMTAGEIEARDTEDRSELTEEERREKYPTTKTENGVVFSDRLEYEPAEKFSLKQPIEQTRDLIAVHNVSEANLLKTLKLGGFIMPSFAITKADMGHSGFADISMLIGKDSINPKETYNGDAWTATMPKAVKKINRQKQLALEEKLGLSGDYYDTLQGDLDDIVSSFENNRQVQKQFIKNNNIQIERKTFDKWRYPYSKEFAEFIKKKAPFDSDFNSEEFRNELVETTFPTSDKEYVEKLRRRKREEFRQILEHYNDHGEKLEKFFEEYSDDATERNRFEKEFWNVLSDIDDIRTGRINQEFDSQAYYEDVQNYINEHKDEFTKFIKDAVNEADIYEGEYLRNDKDTFTPSGNRRSFDQLHMPYTPQNILSLMKKMKKGSVNTWFGGASNLKGASTRSFKSFEDMKNSRDQLQDIPREEIDAKYKELNSWISDIDADICKNNGWQNSWHANDDINSMIAEAFTKAAFNEDSVRRVFAKYDTKITHEDYVKLKALKDELDAIPVKYFEYKPERILGFDEIKVALIPDNSSAELKEALDKAGIPYEEYKAGDEADRLAKLNSHDEVKFSKKGNYSYDSFNLEDKMDIKNANDYNFEKFEVGDSRKDVVTKTKDNIAAYNVDNGLGSEALNNKYIGITNIKTEGIRHSLNRNFAKNGMGYVTTMLPVYFENSIPINEAFGRNDDTEGAYVLIGMFSSDEGDYLVRSVVDHKTKNLNEINWLYALNTKKESSVASATRDNSPKPLSNYSIADFIELAKEYYPNDFSEDVAKFFGYERGKSDIEGLKYSKKMIDDIGVKLSNKYSDADEMFFSEDTWENSEAQTSAKNTADILKEGFNDLQKLKEAGKAHFTHADALRLAEKYQREYGTSTGKEYIANNIESIFAYIENNRDNVRYDDMLRVMRDAAMPIVEKQSNALDEYDDFRKYVKDLNIRLNDQQRAEVINTYGSMKTFRKAIGSRINVTDNGQNIDSLWQDICEASGYYLDPDENSNTQILALADALDSMRDIGDNSGMSTSDKAYDLALNIYTDYFKLNGVENVTKQMKKQIEDYKTASEKAYKEILNKQKEESKMQLDKLRNELKRLEAEKEIASQDKIERADIDKELDRYRQRILKLKDEILVGKAWRRSARLKAAESRQKTILRNRIKSIVNDLSKRLTNPTEGHHVPEGLVNATIDVLQNIDLNTGKSVNMAEKLRKLSEKYEAVRKGYDGENPDYDPTLQKMIDQLGKMFEGRSIAKLSQNELEEVFTICKALQTQIKNMSKFIDSQIKEDIYKTGKNIIEDVNANKGVGEGKLANMANSYLTASVNAERFFNRLSGYKDDSALNKLYDDLNEGSHKMMQIEFDVSDIMKNVLEGDDNQKLADKFKGDNKKDWIETPWKDKNGNTIKVPQSFRASLFMHMMNDQNMKHIMYGGFTLPNEKLYQAGKIKDAYTRGTTVKLVDTTEMREILKQINETESVDERNELWKKYNEAKDKAEKAGKATLKNFLTDMTPYERDWCRYAARYFHDYSGKKINETSLKLNGYAKAVVDNYFPIKTDPSFTRSDMEGVKLDATIEGWGNLKERVNGSNPIVIEGIDRVLNAHSKMLAKYVGMAIPIRNFNKVYGVTLGGYIDSVKKAIGSKFGERSNKFINDLFTDLQTSRTRDDALSKVMNTIRSNYAQAVLTTNLSVAWKQAASYPTAAAELGWDAIGKTMLSKAGLTDAAELALPMWLKKNTKEIMETAEKYTPLLKYRNLGNSTQELGDLKRQRTWLQKHKISNNIVTGLTNWIQNIDTTTVASLWKASEYRVAKDNTNLEPGTDEFYKEVAKVFNKAVERTQPNYTVLQRPDILRSPNEFLKQVFMFKTQPLQNLGIMIDATGNLKAKANAYKADPSAENKAKVDKARKQFRRALTSQVAAAATFSAMTLAVNALLHNLNGYRDDDKELTLEAILKKYFKDVGGAMAGSLPLGTELYDRISSWVTGDKWYDLSVSSIDTINNIIKDIDKIYNADSTTKTIEGTKKLIKDTSMLYGIPLGNIEKIYNGGKYHIEDIKNNEFGSFEAGVERSTKVQSHRMYEALQDGDMDKFNEIYDEVGADKAMNGTSSVTSLIKADYMKDDISYDDAIDYLQEIGFGKKDASDKIYGWNKDYVEKAYKEGKMDADEAKEYLENHNVSKEEADEIIKKCESDLIQEDYMNDDIDYNEALSQLQDAGYSKEESITQIQKWETEYIKKEYENEKVTEEEVADYLEPVGISRNDSHFLVQQWETGSSSDYASVYEAIDNYDTKAIVAAVREMKSYGYDNERLLKASISNKYKQKYIELYNTNKTEAAKLKSAILTYYQACGKEREKASKQVDNWLKEK